jgi:flagellar biosynthesis chaperone FliJ
MSGISLHISPTKTHSKTRHSYSSSRSPPELRNYRRLFNDPKLQKALEIQEKYGEILARDAPYGATEQQVQKRQEMIQVYEKKLAKYGTLLRQFETAKRQYKNYNPKMKGGLHTRKHMKSNKNRSRRFNRR